MAATHESKIKDHDSRLAAQEATTAAMREELRNVASSLKSFAEDTTESIRELARSQQDSHQILADKLAVGQKTNWGPIISSGGVGVAIISLVVGGFASGYIRDQDRLERELSDARDWQMNHDHEVRGINNTQSARLDSNSKSIDALLKATFGVGLDK